ncbi:MAG: hypothetical protein Q9183_005270 [Haloplaca sp. 2 TL-2023]
MPYSQSPVSDHQGQFGMLIQGHTGAENGRTQFGYLSSEPPSNINPGQSNASAARGAGAATPLRALSPAPAQAPMMPHGHPETGGLPIGLTNRNWDLGLLHLSHKMPWVWGKYPSHGEMIPMPLQDFGKILQTEATTIMWSNPFVNRRPDHRYYYDMVFYEMPDGSWIAWWQSTGLCEGFINIQLLDNLEEQSPVGIGSMDVAEAAEPPVQVINHGVKSHNRRALTYLDVKSKTALPLQPNIKSKAALPPQLDNKVNAALLQQPDIKSKAALPPRLDNKSMTAPLQRAQGNS